MELKKFKNTNSLYLQNHLDPFSTDSNYIDGNKKEKKNKLNKLFGIMNKFNRRCIIPLKFYHNSIEFEFSFLKLNKIINSFKKKRLNKAFMLIHLLNEKENNKNIEYEKKNNFFIRAWKIKKRNILNHLENFKLDTKERLNLLKNTIHLIKCLQEITLKKKEDYFTVLLLNYRREIIFERNQKENLVIDNTLDRFEKENSFENLGSSENEDENDSVLNPEDYKDAFADTDRQEENMENSENYEESEEFSENFDTLVSYNPEKKERKKKRRNKKLSSSIYSSRSDLRRKSHNDYEGSGSSYESENENEKRMEKLIKKMIKKHLSKYNKVLKKASKKGDRDNLYEIKLILKDLSKNLGKKGKKALRRYSKKFQGYEYNEESDSEDSFGDDENLKKKLRKLLGKQNFSDSDDEDLIGSLQKLMNDLENLEGDDKKIRDFKKKKDGGSFYSAELKNLCLTLNILFKRKRKKILKKNFGILKNQRDRKISIMNGIKNLQKNMINKKKLNSLYSIFEKNKIKVLKKYFNLLKKKKRKKNNLLKNSLNRLNNINPLLQSIKDNSIYDDNLSINNSKRGTQDFFYMNLEEEYNKKISMKKNLEDSIYEK